MLIDDLLRSIVLIILVTQLLINFKDAKLGLKSSRLLLLPPLQSFGGSVHNSRLFPLFFRQMDIIPEMQSLM